MRISDWSSDVCSSDLGGYPVRVDSHGALELDLPESLARGDAIAWNARFEEQKGLVVDAQGRVHYTGVLLDRLVRAGADVRDGFAASEDRKSTRLNSSH